MTKRLVLLGSVLLLTSAATNVRAEPPVPLPFGLDPAGISLTLNAPESYVPDTAFTVSGFLHAYAALPIIFEHASGIADQPVEVLVDGVVAATATTAADGRYQASISLGPLPITPRTLQARAFTGSAIEKRSRSQEIRQDRILLELNVTPSKVTVGVGEAAQVRAIAEWDDGRTSDVTALATWTSSNTSVATVDGGLVRGVHTGSATITATFRGRSSKASATIA